MSLRILALDTVTEGCSVALVLGSSRVIERFEEMPRGHADRVLPMVQDVLAEAGVTLRELDGIAVGVGPGAFTGVRISVATGQALAFGADLPVLPITSLEALASRLMSANPPSTQCDTLVLSCLDARMGEVYWGSFRARTDGDLEVLTPLQVGAPDNVHLPSPALPGALHGIGRGLSAYPQIAATLGLRVAAGDDRALPRAREAARLGALRLRRGLGLDPALLRPVYLRDKVAMTSAERAASVV